MKRSARRRETGDRSGPDGRPGRPGSQPLEDRPEDPGREIPWHALPAAEALVRLEVDRETGLSDEEARQRLHDYGPNRFGSDTPAPWWRFLLNQFRDVLIAVLAAAALVSAIAGDVADTLAIVAIIVLNAVIGTVQEFRADRTLAALRQILAPDAEVWRGGARRAVDAELLVPGDLVHIGAGAVAPADLRLLESIDLQVDEATLTGESLPVDKAADASPPADAGLPERVTMIHKGSLVARGRALGLVVATGEATALGRIAALLRDGTEGPTPLQRRLARFARRLAFAVLVVCAAVMLLSLLRGEPLLLAFMTAVSLAVAAIPEALPAVVTVALAIGAGRMGRREALIRRLPAVETLGAVSHICSDKTGTLTCNEMRLERWLGNAAGEPMRWAEDAAPDELIEALAISHDVVRGEDGTWRGDPTELALVIGAESAGLDPATAQAAAPRVGEIAFSSERKRMTTVHRRADGALAAVCKGAPEAVLPRCALPAPERDTVLAAADAWASEGYRVLAVAVREGLPDGTRGEGLEEGLRWLGLVGLMDPPRDEAAAAVAECAAAGITVVMITGDHAGTALAIARRLAIAGAEDRAVSGTELDACEEADRAELIRGTRVFARVTPEHKIAIVRCLQEAGHFVAMTGDGVNDAPALKRADIGIAMGLRGTAVAREASDMVLADDNFATIVGAVREGRRIYDNVRKFVAYTMTSNVGELLTVLLAPLLGMPLPLLPLQILWINLVTDGLPGLAMALEEEEPGLMARPPRPPGEGLFSGGLALRIVWVGGLIAALSLGTQALALAAGAASWQTMVFTVLTLAQLFNAFALRRSHESGLRGLFRNPWLLGAAALAVALQAAIVYTPVGNRVFDTTPLSAAEVLICFGTAAIVFLAIELEKRLRRVPGPGPVPTG